MTALCINFTAFSHNLQRKQLFTGMKKHGVRSGSWMTITMISKATEIMGIEASENVSGLSISRSWSLCGKLTLDCLCTTGDKLFN